MKPSVHDVHGKAAFLAPKNLWWQELATNPAMEPLASAVTDFEAGVEPLNVFHSRPIEIGDPNFQAVGHGKLVGKHKELVRQRGTDFKMLKTAELIEALHFGYQMVPGTVKFVAIVTRLNAVVEESIDRWLRRQRENVLIPQEPVLGAKRSN